MSVSVGPLVNPLLTILTYFLTDIWNHGIDGEGKRLWSNLIYSSKMSWGLKKQTKFLKIGSFVIDFWSHNVLSTNHYLGRDFGS